MRFANLLQLLFDERVYHKLLLALLQMLRIALKCRESCFCLLGPHYSCEFVLCCDLRYCGHEIQSLCFGIVLRVEL